MDDELMELVCPSCFESFEIPALPLGECPCEIDYDCEVCCRPMVVSVDGEGMGSARSLDDL